MPNPSNQTKNESSNSNSTGSSSSGWVAAATGPVGLGIFKLITTIAGSSKGSSNTPKPK